MLSSLSTLFWSTRGDVVTIDDTIAIYFDLDSSGLLFQAARDNTYISPLEFPVFPKNRTIDHQSSKINTEGFESTHDKHVTSVPVFYQCSRLFIFSTGAASTETTETDGCWPGSLF